MTCVLALMAAALLACGLGRVMVVCQTAHGIHVELAHAAAECSHGRPTVIVCSHGCRHHRDTGPTRVGAHTDANGGSCWHGSCYDWPLLIDIGPTPSTAHYCDQPLQLAMTSAPTAMPLPLKIAPLQSGHDPPGRRPPAELRRTVQLLL